MKEILESINAPKAIGPYSQAVKAGNTVYVSGQLGIDPATGEFAGDGSACQAKQSIKNIEAILKEAGMTLADVVKTTVLIKDMNDFAAVNEVYATFFTENYPARACFEVARLPKDGLVEIEAVAVK